MREQDRQRRLGQQALGCTAEDEFAPSRVAIGTHHEDVGSMRKRMGFKNLANRPAVCVDLVQQHINAAARQVLGEFLGRAVRIVSLVTVTTRTVLARSSKGSASETARAAARLKSQATRAVPSSNGRGRGLSGKTRVGRPDPKINASAYH